MPRHHGDPRSDVFGEQPYDESEYPNAPYTPPAAPPVPGNAGNFIPYRGQEQHGVQITRNTEHDTGSLPFAEEQRAQDKYTDPTVTPRDLSNVPPIRVVQVDAPDLLYRRKARVFSYTVAANGVPVQVLQAENQRKRVVVSLMSVDPSQLAYYSYATSGDATSIQSAMGITSPYSAGATIDSQFTQQLWVTVPATYGPAATTNYPVIVSVWVEYTQSDGENLIS